MTDRGKHERGTDCHLGYGCGLGGALILTSSRGLRQDMARLDERIGGLEALDSQDELEEPPNPWKMD